MADSTPHFKVGTNVSNSANGSTLELWFTDSIYNKVNYWSGEEESMLADVIKQVQNSNPTHIVQYIDSWGGSAPVGFGIYNYLKGHSAKVETKILNNCASIATVMACAGNKGKITMPRNGMMVIHQAQNSAQGTAAELREAANVCDKYTEQVLDVYVQNNRMGKTRDELYNLIKDGDYWMTGTEAKAMGFVDDTYNDPAITITNSIAAAKTVYNNIPQRILDMATNEVPTDEVAENHPNNTNILNKFLMKVQDIVNSFKTSLPTNGAPAGVDFSTLLDAPITNLVTQINESVTADIQAAAEKATESVTNAVSAVEAKYKEVLDGFGTSLTTVTNSVTELTNKLAEAEAKIAELSATNESLTADISTMQGKQAPAAGNDPTNNATTGPKTFKGRTKPYHEA